MPRWPLRRTLVVATVALVTLAALVIGLVSVLSVQSILMGRIDAQLVAATSRSTDAVGGAPGDKPRGGGGGEAPGFISAAGQSVGTLGILIVGNDVWYAGYLDENGRRQPLTASQAQAIVDAGLSEQPTTVNLGNDLGDYRLVMNRDDNGVTLVVGLPLGDVQYTVTSLLAVVLAVTIAALLLAAAAGYALVRFTLRPLDRVAEAATTVSRMRLDRGEVALAVRVADDDADGRTEVGRVGAAINRMLEHVSNALSARQASEDKVRRFVSDASHELRTPLASIRGYAELTRMGGNELPDDAAYALGRIESESVRMTSIVEDLLLLARLDEGRQLEQNPVDLQPLVTNAVSDARVSAPDHEWAIEVPDAPAIVTGDAARLFQVITNLVANARVHTPAGTTVTTSVAVDAASDRVIVTVHDDGPGIAPEMTDAVFERFVRGDSSRARSTGSTGLGLAIVHAVVAAHGGEASVQSEPGATTFRLELPRGGASARFASADASAVG